MIICKDIDALIIKELNVSSWIKYRTLCINTFMMMTKDEVLRKYHKYVLKFCKKRYPPQAMSPLMMVLVTKGYINYERDLFEIFEQKFERKINKAPNFQAYLINILNKNNG
jgi:hypothetical protein